MVTTTEIQQLMGKIFQNCSYLISLINLTANSLKGLLLNVWVFFIERKSKMVITVGQIYYIGPNRKM